MSNDEQKVIHHPSASGGEFTIGRQAVMSYRDAGDGHIIVNHTLVDPKLRGKGVAAKLYHAMVEYARKNKLQVTPTCSYAERMFERYPDDTDVLRKAA